MYVHEAGEAAHSRYLNGYRRLVSLAVSVVGEEEPEMRMMKKERRAGNSSIEPELELLEELLGREARSR